jgi:hypothetical protein
VLRRATTNSEGVGGEVLPVGGEVEGEEAGEWDSGAEEEEEEEEEEGEEGQETGGKLCSPFLSGFLYCFHVF